MNFDIYETRPLFSRHLFRSAAAYARGPEMVTLNCINYARGKIEKCPFHGKLANARKHSRRK